ADLATAEDTAAQQSGVVAISNSYGGSEFSSETSLNTHYNHPGLAITVSSGDSGYGAQYPAASPDVTAVGGTTLNKSTTGTYSETAWNGAGSGCSAYEPQPSWQSSVANISGSSGSQATCHNRAIADVAADADPN